MKSRKKRDHSQLIRRLETVIALSLCVALLTLTGALAWVSLGPKPEPTHPVLTCVAGPSPMGVVIYCIPGPNPEQDMAPTPSDKPAPIPNPHWRF